MRKANVPAKTPAGDSARVAEAPLEVLVGTVVPEGYVPAEAIEVPDSPATANLALRCQEGVTRPVRLWRAPKKDPQDKTTFFAQPDKPPSVICRFVSGTLRIQLGDDEWRQNGYRLFVPAAAAAVGIMAV